MSKKRDQYLTSFERVIECLEFYLQENTVPEKTELQEELDYIRGLRPLKVNLSFPDEPLNEKEGYCFLIEEEYRRYDDILPQAIHVSLLPGLFEEQKELNKFLTANR